MIKLKITNICLATFKIIKTIHPVGNSNDYVRQIIKKKCSKYFFAAGGGEAYLSCYCICILFAFYLYLYFVFLKYFLHHGGGEVYVPLLSLQTAKAL